MGRKQEFTAQQVIDACEGTAGIMAIVAKKLGCTRTTICRYAKRYPTVRAALDQADKEATDLAENKSMTLINEGYWPAIKYRLATKGKDRGYSERHEIDLRNLDLSKLNESQLERIANGEDPIRVLATPGGS